MKLREEAKLTWLRDQRKSNGQNKMEEQLCLQAVGQDVDGDVDGGRAEKSIKRQSKH